MRADPCILTPILTGARLLCTHHCILSAAVLFPAFHLRRSLQCAIMHNLHTAQSALDNVHGKVRGLSSSWEIFDKLHEVAYRAIESRRYLWPASLAIATIITLRWQALKTIDSCASGSWPSDRGSTKAYSSLQRLFKQRSLFKIFINDTHASLSSPSSLDLTLAAYHGIKAPRVKHQRTVAKTEQCRREQVQYSVTAHCTKYNEIAQCTEHRTHCTTHCEQCTEQPQGLQIGDAPPHSSHCDGDTDVALFHKSQRCPAG